MRLRYAGRCRSCAVALANGDLAVYDPTARKVLCLPCAGTAGPDSPAPAARPFGTRLQGPGPTLPLPSRRCRTDPRGVPLSMASPAWATSPEVFGLVVPGSSPWLSLNLSEPYFAELAEAVWRPE